MQQLLLHCGGLPATFEDIAQVEIPHSTSTFRAVPHADLVRLVEEEIGTRLKLSKPERNFGLNRAGNQMFGTLKYDLRKQSDDLDLDAFQNFKTTDVAVRNYGFTIGLRNAYDKSMSCGLAGGTNCFVCDNLCFHGNAFTIMRKHTQHVWRDLVPLVMTKVHNLANEYVQTVTFQENMKQVQVQHDRGYEILGLARGHGVLTSTQMNASINDWRDVNGRDKDHAFRDYAESSYALYNSFTHGLKLGHVGRKIDEYTGASKLFEDLKLADSVEIEDAEIH